MSKQMDMVNGSLGNKIIQYAIPLAVTGIFQQLFNAADIAVVGRFAGKEAMAAVGSNAPLIGLLVNLFIGISLGANVVIARSIGQRNEAKVSRAVHTSILIAVFGGLLLILLGETLAPEIVKMLGAPEDVFPLSVKYLRIYLLGMPVILLYNFESAIFRSSGNTKTPLIALMISGVINVILNVCFVVLFGMDVDGVAIATVLANLISSAILFSVLLKTDQVVKVHISELRVHADVLREILRIGVPAGVQSMIFSFANIIIQSSINSLGTTIIAASAAAFNTEVFVYYILNSFGQACTTFVGQNHGAGKPDRCQRVLKLCLIQCAVSMAIACSLVLLFSWQILYLFNTDPEVIRFGQIRLQYIFFAYCFSFAQEVMSGYMRGFGYSTVPAACSVIGICGVRLAWIFTIFRMSPTFQTIMQVYPLSLGITAVMILITILIMKPGRA